MLSFLYSPTLTSIHDHWKNHGLDQTDLCWHGCKHPRKIGISLINGKNNCSQSILCIQRVLHLVIENHSNIIHHRDIRSTSQQYHSPSWLLTLLFPFFASAKAKKKKKVTRWTKINYLGVSIQVAVLPLNCVSFMKQFM